MPSYRANLWLRFLERVDARAYLRARREEIVAYFGNNGVESTGFLDRALALYSPIPPGLVQGPKL